MRVLEPCRPPSRLVRYSARSWWPEFSTTIEHCGAQSLTPASDRPWRKLMDLKTQRKWDKASSTFDFLTFGDDHRLGPHKRRLFAKMHGTTLMVAAGTGNDFRFFPPGRSIIAIDISAKMLERAARKASVYQGKLELRQADVCELEFPDNSFDTVATVCTFCSVPSPVAGLRELY